MTFSTPQQRIEYFKNWLQKHVFPIWSKNGIDEQTHIFHETLDYNSQVVSTPRRCLVQARQAYSFLTGARMNVVTQQQADTAILQSIDAMIKYYQQEDGSFIFSIDENQQPVGKHKPLYTQAFAIFGLAQAYSISSKTHYKMAALKCLQYLHEHRKNAAGGFTEVDDKSQITFASNPHMHLFEAALAWVAIEEAREWKELSHHIAQLAMNKFICPQQKVLGEFFDFNWEHLRIDGKFIYEPGHQFEWAWLFKVYDELLETNTFEVRHQLFTLAEKHGVSEKRKLAYDEMWSDYSVKSASARFWPQGERVKAAARLATEVSGQSKEQYQKAADEALESLFRYLETPTLGYWFDQLSPEDTWKSTTAKASSLYHIINAMEEYEVFRNQ